MIGSGSHHRLLMAFVLGPLSHVAAGQNGASPVGRLQPVSVADSIQMTTLTESGVAPAKFSADGKHFVIVTRRGNLTNNTVEYSLFLFTSADAFSGAHPKHLLTLASSSNRPAISDVRWSDSRTIVFLGATLKSLRRIYSLQVNTRKLTRLAQHSTDILAFDFDQDLDTIVFMARPPSTVFVNEATLGDGFVVSNQPLTDLIKGRSSDSEFGVFYPFEVFVARKGTGVAKVDLKGYLPRPENGLSVSPDGKYAIVKIFMSIPDSWRRYHNKRLQTGSDAVGLLLINTKTGSPKLLVDAPLMNLSGGAEWVGNGKSAVIAGCYLPLGIGDTPEEVTRQSNMFVAEIDPESGGIQEITMGDFAILSWNSRTHVLVLQSQSDQIDKTIAFRRGAHSWERLDSTAALLMGRAFEVTVEQDMNTPPRITAVNLMTHEKAMLMDLNPEFRYLKLGAVEEITWKGTDGHDARGGMFFPSDYLPGRRYPLVIQTHGWNPDQFMMDGISTAGYAARALASRGFVVAQVAISPELLSTREGPQQVAMFEGLIDYLDGRGLIDRSRVGLLGWSRTGYHVRYALAFSKYPFAAAVIADGLDDGYVHYITWLNLGQKYIQPYEQFIGSPPFRDGIRLWTQHATGFSLENVHTPLRLLGFGPYALISNWEWFAGLQHLGKPVEMIWLPDAEHSPVKPFERITAQQGNVDWFCFWLQGKEDPDPTKAGQYARWRQLRAQEEAELSAHGRR